MYLNFKELKKLSLKCSSKKNGRMYNRNFRLWYDKNSDTVKLINRHDDKLAAESFINNSTTIQISPTDIGQYCIKAFAGLYGVYFCSIKANEGTKRHNSHHIFTDSEQKFVYIPGGIELRNGNIISANNYRQDVLDEEWKKQYMLTSKRNRASFAAMNNIISNNSISKSKPLKRIFHTLKQVDPLLTRTVQAVNLVMSTPKPNGEDIMKLRKLLRTNGQANIRKEMQKLINGQRYDRAFKEGAIRTVSTENYPK